MVANPADLASVHPATAAAGHDLLPRRLMFLLGVPVLFSVYLTFSSGPLLADPGYVQTFSFYLGHSLLPWLFTAFMTSVAMRLLARWRPGLVVLTTLGSVASCLLTIPYVEWLGGVYEWSAYAVMRPPVSEDWYVLLALLKATVIWIVTNLVFDRYVGLPRYRYAGTTRHGPGLPTADPPSAAPPTDPSASTPGQAPDFVPGFMARLDRPVPLAELIALKSEQHYVQVMTTRGRQLVLYRLGDAVHELPPDLGLQVHRSWWVARHAMHRGRRHGRKMTLELTDGTAVPVSIPHQQLVRRLLASREAMRRPSVH